MNWASFYLICFGVGFSLSLISFLMGALHLHLPLRWHLPHGLGHHGGGSLHAGHGGPAGTGKGGGTRQGDSHMSWLNSSTMLAFLAWFGGTGYLLTRFYRMWYALALGLATLSGVAAAGIVFWFMVKVLMKHESQLFTEDFRMEGLVGTVNVAIRENGTGEIIFSQNGARRSTGARSEDGKSLEKGTEIVITKYEKGIAYVRRWDEFTQ